MNVLKKNALGIASLSTVNMVLSLWICIAILLDLIGKQTFILQQNTFNVTMDMPVILYPALLVLLVLLIVKILRLDKQYKSLQRTSASTIELLSNRAFSDKAIGGSMVSNAQRSHIFLSNISFIPVLILAVVGSSTLVYLIA